MLLEHLREMDQCFRRGLELLRKLFNRLLALKLADDLNSRAWECDLLGMKTLWINQNRDWIAIVRILRHLGDECSHMWGLYVRLGWIVGGEWIGLILWICHP